MNYLEAMNLLSQCSLGAVVVNEENKIVEANDMADRLLDGNGMLRGKRLDKIASPLLGDAKDNFINIKFGKYLMRCPTPTVEDLPEKSQIIVFRDASRDAYYKIFSNVIDNISESVVICDDQERILYLNNAADKMDGLTGIHVLGEMVTHVYTGECTIPQVIRNKAPLLKHRQHYSTKYGKDVDTVTNTYPIIINNRVMGGFNVMQDWSTVDTLRKQVIDLQEKLVEDNGKDKKEKSSLSATYTFDDIICQNDAMKDVVEQCRRVARSNSSVMLYGETGTGKEMFAQSIHNASLRANGPFIAINCAALPENLLEGMLFGTEKGAYTGAVHRSGLFEQANHGTLLLDEINSMNISLQTKLLRVLQDGKIRHIGGSQEIQVDVRVLSNINIPPYQAIAEHKLRQDLYYRLGVVNITIPPLRERSGDIPLLCRYFIQRYNRELQKGIRGIDEQTLGIFNRYRWPGNVRELQHAIEHAMNVMPESATLITSEYIPKHIIDEDNSPEAYLGEHGNPASSSKPFTNTLKDLERSTICQVLIENNGNISKSARQLKMSRQNLQYRIKRYHIDIPSLLYGDKS